MSVFHFVRVNFRAFARRVVNKFWILHGRPLSYSKPYGGIFLLDTYTPSRYMSSMQNETKAAIHKRLNRIEGQVRGLSRMVEEDRYCIDVIMQISAVRAALRRAEEEILRDHVSHCVEHAIASGEKKEQRIKIAELIDVLSRSAR